MKRYSRVYRLFRTTSGSIMHLVGSALSVGYASLHDA